jgi:hypothetical protein
MRRYLFLLLFLLLFFFSSSLWADEVSLGELVSNPLNYDQKVIEVKGEVIGDPLRDSGGYWVNISDGKGTVGVFVKEVDWEGKLQGGDYNRRGDIISVKGLFSASCVKHGGDLDIHAQRLIFLKESKPQLRPLEARKVFISLLLLFLVLISLFLRS